MYDYYENTQEEKKINVSKLFFEIYKNFNVTSQVHLMKQLNDRELFLLLTVCLDKFSDEDPVVKYNLLPFKDEIMLIFDIQDDKEPTNQTLINLIEETGDKYIETDNLYFRGESLPEPLTKEEVRDAKINIINNDDN
jgi:hypothetical protein